MAYATYSDIQDEFKSIALNSTSAITTGKITEWIAQEEAWIESQVRTVYLVPVTGSPSAVSIMKKLSVLQVKARMLDILEVKTGSEGESQGLAGDGLREQVKAMLDDIISKKMLLDGATLAEVSAGVKSHTNSNCNRRAFSRDREMW